VIVTDVDYVCVNFQQKNEKKLKELTAKEAKKYLMDNQFSEGSMKPKVEAMIDFVESTGNEGIICSLNNLQYLKGTMFKLK
jgi:carbamate kinase